MADDTCFARSFIALNYAENTCPCLPNRVYINMHTYKASQKGHNLLNAQSLTITRNIYSLHAKFYTLWPF